MKNLRFILLLVKMKFSHMLVFRLSFFGAFFADSFLFIVQIYTFNIIYEQVETIGNWNQGQMLVFIGTFSMINGLNMLIYFFGILDIPQKIRTGGLDLYMTKPGNTLLRLTFENINPGSAPLILFSGGIIAYGISEMNVSVTFSLILSYTVLVLLMTLLYYDMELILRTIPFFVLSSSAIDYLEGEMLMLNFKIPGEFFQGTFKIIFYFILPYGIMATIPTQLIAGSLSLHGLLLSVATVILFTMFALQFWHLGLRHYQSASS